MAIAILGTTTHDSGSSSNASSPRTWTQTNHAGSNRLLLVLFAMRRTTAPTLGAVTYGGQAMTQVTGSPQNGATACTVAAFYLDEAGIAAASGETVSVAYSGSTTVKFVGISRMFSGVDQTTPLGTWAGATNAGSGVPTVTVTSAVDELVADIAYNAGATLLTVGADQTDVAQDSTSHGTDASGSTSVQIGAASVVMSWSSATGENAIGAVPMKPAAAGGASVANRMLLLGVG